ILVGATLQSTANSNDTVLRKIQITENVPITVFTVVNAKNSKSANFHRQAAWENAVVVVSDPFFTSLSNNLFRTIAQNIYFSRRILIFRYHIKKIIKFPKKRLKKPRKDAIVSECQMRIFIAS
ncbi:MAG: hypothetical protein IKB16_05220, partial [Lentisphaeria bacterium]|nr:hypothetical protein [Lentisphaeria bacterium]